MESKQESIGRHQSYVPLQNVDFVPAQAPLKIYVAGDGKALPTQKSF